MARKSRDDFTKPITDVLAKRAAFICSNPSCRVLTIAPSNESLSKFLYTGKVAHISAAAPGGPRYNPQMTPDQRREPSNGIFLCGNCADLVDKNQGLDFSADQLLQWKKEHDIWVAANLNKSRRGRGGDGGRGTIRGNRGVIVGGRGGDGGVEGTGGDGGGGHIEGDDGVILGGDGGHSATADGRGGRGAHGPTERLGFPSTLWGVGRGGSGSNLPEYDRRIALLKAIRGEYLAKFPSDARYIDAGIDQVPVDWINQRLVELQENWRVEIIVGGYILPSLN